VTTAGWDPATLRKEQLNGLDIGSILQGVESGQRPKWKYISDRSPTYKRYWTQWKSLAVRNSILERKWESSNGQSAIAQTVISRSRVKAMLTKLRTRWTVRRSAGYNKTSSISDKDSTGSKREAVLKNGGDSVTPVQPVAGRGPRAAGQESDQMHKYNIGAPFEGIAIELAGPFQRSKQGNRHLLIAMDYFTKWSEV
jgi:hypothetical protein